MTCATVASISFLPAQLAQASPSTTLATEIYSPGSGVTIIKTIFIANVTTSATTFRLFLDPNGETYSIATALFYDVPIDANSTVLLTELDILMISPSAHMAAQSGTASALTFSVFGGTS